MSKDKAQNLDKVGVCIKSQDETVEYQNELCLELCGIQVGSKCAKGCMQRYSRGAEGAPFSLGLKLLKNVDTGGHSVDAVLINDGDKLTTILYDKSDALKKQMDSLKGFHLSKAELTVMEKCLQGFSNQDVASQLFISKATLRTHLNNIYKKLPAALKAEILASHLGVEIKK